MISNPSPKTPGEMIDAVLTPYINDEAHLAQRLEQTQAQITELQVEMDQIGNDLEVIKSAKLDALREAVGQEPLLRAAFSGQGDAVAPAEELEVVEDDQPQPKDRHPLLSPIG